MGEAGVGGEIGDGVQGVRQAADRDSWGVPVERVQEGVEAGGVHRVPQVAATRRWPSGPRVSAGYLVRTISVKKPVYSQ